MISCGAWVGVNQVATEKRLIDANECYERSWDYTAFYHHVADMSILRDLLNDCPTVDAVPVDKIKLHHVIIDNEGVPEVKLQIGDRYFILRTDPVDVREVVHGVWMNVKETEVYSPDHRCTFTHTAQTCSACNVRIGFIGAKIYLYDDYCPNCCAKMRGSEE